MRKLTEDVIEGLEAYIAECGYSKAYDLMIDQDCLLYAQYVLGSYKQCYQFSEGFHNFSRGNL